MLRKKNVIVLGMARSGTSLAASILARKGYFVAASRSDELQKPNKYNPSGFWEARSLIENNVEVLAAVGFKSDNTWFHEAITPEQASRIAQLEPQAKHIAFVEEFNRHSPWLWKDPRLCYTLDYWWPLLDQEETCVLHVTRDADETFRSFQRVADDWHVTVNIEKSTIYRRIDEHRASAQRIIEKYAIPHLTVDYSEYQSAPESVARGLTDLMGIDICVDDLGFQKNAAEKFESSASQRLKKLLKRLLGRLPR